MMLVPLPRLIPVSQRFAPIPLLDVSATIRSQLEELGERGVPRDGRIAVAVGSRGIANLRQIVAQVVEWFRERGAKPFIVPAMGSHGGATPEGQAEILAGFGITEAVLGVPICASMEVTEIGRTADGVAVYFSTEALAADGIVVINRVKPHTDFAGRIGSGILKMTAIGLGKHVGASTVHAAAMSFGYEHVIRTVARRVFEKAPILASVAVLEGPRHETARIEVLKPGEIEQREEELFAEARSLMPRLPFDQIDLLIVDRMGKNISGTGMDPNVIGRGAHGYSTLFSEQQTSRSLGPRRLPVIRRIFVRELTPETHGNAIGIGLADFATRRLVEAMDRQATSINVLTALSLHLAKIPMYFDTDREAIEHALISTCLPDTSAARVVRIVDTLSLENVHVSEAHAAALAQNPQIEPRGEAREMAFDEGGNLLPF
ncbi:MAG: lactate racemase domain-containing protein [Terriglobia bacterium]